MGSWLQIRIIERIRGVGIRKRIWLTISIISFGTIMTAIGLTYFLYENFYVDNQKESLLHQGENLVEEYYASHGADAFEARLRWTNANTKAETIHLKDPRQLNEDLPFQVNGTSFISKQQLEQLQTNQTVTIIKAHPALDQDILAIIHPLMEEGVLTGAIFSYLPLEQVYAPFESIRVIIMGILLTLIILVVWIGKSMTDRLLHPLKTMEAISEQMARGDFSKRITLKGKDEIGSLAQSFNTLSSSLQEVENKRREFLQNVSHELRTPLSYVHGYTEALLDQKVRDEEERERYVTIIHQEVQRMNRLVNDLLDLAQLEGESYPMQQAPIPFAQLVRDVAERFQLRASKEHKRLTLTVDDEIIVKGDSDRLDQVVSNLLDNAFHYTGENGTIDIALQRKEGEVSLSISDSGEGIPPKDVHRIMERFYRVNKARTRSNGGVGLGLAIVQQIVQRHSGTIHIDSTLGLGTTLEVILPLYLLEE
ncbi:sensor histidine kinase [Pontibacillus salicampi]|uniref:histidine kinase n=1 Tax=Pontibacillus salicampi TaxID=1449801 RepID=A0ABV6LRD6_9BACI